MATSNTTSASNLYSSIPPAMRLSSAIEMATEIFEDHERLRRMTGLNLGSEKTDLIRPQRGWLKSWKK
ncbi:MAG: hypothetical protein NTV11_20310 [Rhodocyclales bacterium]|nr:hypothetical protein [Rhodocyclales bacterium]